MGQLSFYSADAHPCALSDLEGVLCGRGEVVVFGRGTTARLSVVLGAPAPPPEEDDQDGAHADDPGPAAAEADDAADADAEADDAAADLAPDGPDEAPAVDPADLEFLDLDPEELAAVLAPTTVPARGSRRPAVSGANALADPPPAPPAALVAPVVLAPVDPVAEWRARVLCGAFHMRGVDAELARAPDGRPVVRSAFRADLTGLARRWTHGAVKAVPESLELDGPRLRLWVLTAGRRAGHAYVLGLDPHAEHTHAPLLAASHRAGLGATLGVSRQEPCLRIIGRRRQGRLGELVGDPPPDLAADVWPQ